MEDPTHIVIEFARTGDATDFALHWDASMAREDRDDRRRACDDPTVSYEAYTLTKMEG